MVKRRSGNDANKTPLPALAAVLLVLLSASCGERHDLVIRSVTVVDLETGDATPRDIAVDGNRISAISAQAGKGALEIDGSELYAIPGLWDMHVHITDPAYFSLMVANGVVGARDMGGDLDTPGDGCGAVKIEQLRAWRADIEKGMRIGPQLYFSGPVASARKWPEGDQTGPARAAVREAADRGADFIKIYEDVTPAGFAALMDEARQRNLPVAGHVSEETLTILEAIRAGQRSIEHVRSHFLVCFAETEEELEAFYIADAWTEDGRRWGEMHRRDCPSIWGALRAGGVWITSTLAVERTWIDGAAPGFEEDPRRARLPRSVQDAVDVHVAHMRERKLDPKEWTIGENWWKTQLAFIARANREGASILSGTDAACEGVIPGYSLHDQLSYLGEAGLSPVEALRTATLEPAAYLGRADHSGKIAEGFDADFLLLRSDPRASIAATREIEAVILRGAYHDRAALTRLLDGIEDDELQE